MPYTFRKYSGYNANEIKCWSPTGLIRVDNFEISDTQSKRGASKIGTSIPSPMARMELFDTAFQMVSSDSQRNGLDGSSVYHQLVSDCLDMIQLLFNTNSSDIGTGKKIWFKEWRVQESLNRLKSKPADHPHQLLGKAFSLIFDTQATSSGFSGMESIYLIYYENRLMGGTSPLTLFFTSPNWDRYIADKQIANVPKGSDGVPFFGDKHRALFERDRSFVEYLYQLLLSNPAGFAHCAGLRQYINKTVERYFPDFTHQFADWGPNGTKKLGDEYSPFKTEIGSKLLKVNEIFFYHQSEEVKRRKIKNVSDFVIQASNQKYALQHDKDGNQIRVEAPLVLVEGMNFPGDYMEERAAWDATTRINYFLQQHTPLFERRLPQGDSLTVTYPFLTTGDFLEDYLMEMPFKINRNKFFTGVGGDFKFLLPVKKEYFNFFDFEDLKRNLEINASPGQVVVTLKVPIKNKKGVREITFTKTYSGNQIKMCKADIGIFPFYKISEKDPAYHYLNDFTILLAEKNDELQLESLNFYNYDHLVCADNSQPEHLRATVVERTTAADIDGAALTESRFYKLKESFDYMELRYQDNGLEVSGIVIPNFEGRVFNKLNLNKAITFAIDFGTSNTHIAFKEKSSPLPLPFEIDEADQQMVMLNEPLASADLGTRYDHFGQLAALQLTVNREFMPRVIKSKGHSTVSFPFKTATCEVSTFNNMDKQAAALFGHINIGFNIEREENTNNSAVYTTNLKWLLENNLEVSKIIANKARVSLFLKQLMLHIRTKAILNLCKPEELNVLWSIPSSMDRKTRTELTKIIKEAYLSVFPNADQKKINAIEEPIKESVAPYFFLTKNGSGIQDGANVVNVDIGGGTTDIMMFMESTAKRYDKYLASSFRFAGNDIWGSGYKGNLKDNGFIHNYQTFQKENNIETKDNKYLLNAQRDNNLSSDDLISLLFRYDKSFGFSESITNGNPNLSIVLYLHYSAIIYHICQIIETKKYPLPQYLSFTGKGSQYLKLLCNGSEKELNNFTKLLFEAYSSQSIPSLFQVHVNEDPKVITANGTIEYFGADLQDQFVEIPRDADFSAADADPRKKYKEFVLTGDLQTGHADTKTTTISDTLELDNMVNIGVLKNVNEFVERTLANKKIVDFLSDFKITNAKTVYNELKWNGGVFDGEGLVYDSYRKVLKDLHKLDHEQPLPESLFFYAFKDTLYRLSKSITQSNPS